MGLGHQMSSQKPTHLSSLHHPPSTTTLIVAPPLLSARHRRIILHPCYRRISSHPHRTAISSSSHTSSCHSSPTRECRHCRSSTDLSVPPLHLHHLASALPSSHPASQLPILLHAQPLSSSLLHWSLRVSTASAPSCISIVVAASCIHTVVAYPHICTATTHGRIQATISPRISATTTLSTSITPVMPSVALEVVLLRCTAVFMPLTKKCRDGRWCCRSERWNHVATALLSFHPFHFSFGSVGDAEVVDVVVHLHDVTRSATVGNTMLLSAPSTIV